MNVVVVCLKGCAQNAAQLAHTPLCVVCALEFANLQNKSSSDLHPKQSPCKTLVSGRAEKGPRRNTTVVVHNNNTGGGGACASQPQQNGNHIKPQNTVRHSSLDEKSSSFNTTAPTVAAALIHRAVPTS